ncbi:MAG: heme-copper oxidase subunit III [Phycisphaera sp.]|nr:heme-copper oxidase subunit III [Phycisphaera sp.]
MANIDSPFDDPRERATAGIFGMACFIVSLAMLFASTILGVVVVRLQDPESWALDGIAGLPPGLLASTAVLLASSATMVVASRAAKEGAGDRLSRWITVTFVLAIVFLLLQAVAWWELLRLGVGIDSNLWAWTFYVLTALHALHVIGGVVPMGIVTLKARRRGYSTTNHRGVTYVGMYWHFLDLAWICLYATLWWATDT